MTGGSVCAQSSCARLSPLASLRYRCQHRPELIRYAEQLMYAIQQHAVGGPKELRYEEVQDPHPSRGQIRIRVESAGVHLIDTAIRRSERSGPLPPPKLPMIPGREVAGVVDELGPGVDQPVIGSRVVVDLGVASGGYAQFAIADVNAVHAVPNGIDADEAVDLIGTGRTSMAILELAAPSPDDTAVMTAAAGGVGSLVVQGLVRAGATVIGVAGGPDRVGHVRALGAIDAIDYLNKSWTNSVRAASADRPITLAIDGVGGDIGRSALELLDVGGRLVMHGSSSGRTTQLSSDDIYARGVTVSAAIGARLLRRPGGLRSLETSALNAAAEAWLRPIVGQRFALSDAWQAHEAIESRATIGKTVLRPWQA
jgi:NADPH2:quinone reductase